MNVSASTPQENLSFDEIYSAAKAYLTARHQATVAKTLAIQGGFTSRVQSAIEDEAWHRHRLMVAGYMKLGPADRNWLRHLLLQDLGPNRVGDFASG